MKRVAVCLLVALAWGCGTSSLKIVGTAMSPTFKNGDSVLATRTIDKLERGDIVGFRYPEDESKSFIQRIVGLPGERIESRDGIIIVNGRPLDEPYVADSNRSKDSWGPKLIPQGHYFMMGDNRGNSADSRSWGTVKRELVWAKVMFQ